ncbi:MAG: hypothetical protein ABL962_16885 [Fimbriimonadaceae bacterium]
MPPEPEIRYLKSFVVYTLIATVTGLVIGMFQGAILGAALSIAGFDLHTVRTTCGITGFIVGVLISFFVFRWIIRTQILPQIAKHYEGQHQ